MLQLTLPALIVACSVSPRADIQSTLYRVAIAHSHGLQYHVYNASTATAYTPSGAKTTASTFTQLAAAHHDVHIGLMGLNRRTLARWRVTPLEATDACTNVKVASLELMRLMPRRTNEDRIHKALAKFYSPSNSSSVEAIDWGAKVLAQPSVNVQVQSKATYQRASVTYNFAHTSLVQSGSTALVGKPTALQGGLVQQFKHPTHPKKWEPKQVAASDEAKPRVKTKKTKTAVEKETSKSLGPKDLAPYHTDGPQIPVTDRKL